MDQTMARSTWFRALAAVTSLTMLGGVAAAVPAAAAPPAQPVIGAPALDRDGCARIEKTLPTLSDWPKVDSRLTGKPQDEQRIQQIRATGQDWAFSPTLAVVQDDRWGRTYEGFSEDPRITRAYGYEAIDGLQDGATKRIGASGVIATAKHFIGDGGTAKGQDQGVNQSSEADMINIHGQGYYGALGAGAQTVMASFNSWTNADLGITEGKVHGSDKVLNQILKGKIGFDGLVVSDWNGIGQVTGCTNASCPRAINAGLDIIMVPNDWKAFITNTVAQVRSGEIPMSRIDDAVTRILRVKLRAGLFEAQKPSDRSYAESGEALTDRWLARDAVRESQTLLKNNGNVLPLASKAKVLVVGKSADSIQN